jgi:hypothetical protein
MHLANLQYAPWAKEDTMNSQNHEIFSLKVVPSTAFKAVTKISAASGELSPGMEQINWAIRNLNQAAQRNASASKELSSAAEELASQFKQLSASVEYFRMSSAERKLIADSQREAFQHRGKAAVSAKALKGYFFAYGD